VLINVIVCCTPENGRGERALRVLDLITSVAHRHHIIVSNNASTDERVLDRLHTEHQRGAIEVFTAPQNHYLVAALNLGLHMAGPHEMACSVEDDSIIPYTDWADVMESILLNTKASGVSFLPSQQHTREFGAATKHILPGRKEVTLYWTNEEYVWNGCTAWHPRVRETIGYFYFPHPYGAIDYLWCQRVFLAGMKIAASKEYEIEETGWPSDSYLDWKCTTLEASWGDFHKLKKAYAKGTRPLYEPYVEHEWITGVQYPRGLV